MGDGAPSSTKTRYSVGSGLIDESQNNNTIQITSNMRDQNLTSRCKPPELSTGGGGGEGGGFKSITWPRVAGEVGKNYSKTIGPQLAFATFSRIANYQMVAAGL